MDMQNRPGAKTGSFGHASGSLAAAERAARLKALAAEVFDVAKDPYFFRNSMGGIECRLCATIHPNEGNYLAHTQARKHQENLTKRAAREAKAAAAAAGAAAAAPGG